MITLSWIKARIKIHPETGCWEWQRKRKFDGYGSKSISYRDSTGRKRYTTILIHRRVWELVNGPIPENVMVCHRCDNPPCCNPDHLFLGTCQDNVTDMAIKGRQHAKLTEEQVRTILARRADGVSCEQLGREFGVWDSTIRRIIRGAAWKQVTSIAPVQVDDPGAGALS